MVEWMRPLELGRTAPAFAGEGVPPFRKGPLHNVPDYSQNRTGARRLADRIEQVWAENGRLVTCTVRPVYFRGSRILCYEITSDMLDGLPRDGRDR